MFSQYTGAVIGSKDTIPLKLLPEPSCKLKPKIQRFRQYYQPNNGEFYIIMPQVNNKIDNYFQLVNKREEEERQDRWRQRSTTMWYTLEEENMIAINSN